MIITGSHCRAARALLGLSQENLAEAAGIGVASVKRFEAGAPLTKVIEKAIQSALAVAGVGFVEEGKTVEGRVVKAGVLLFARRD